MKKSYLRPRMNMFNFENSHIVQLQATGGGGGSFADSSRFDGCSADETATQEYAIEVTEPDTTIRITVNPDSGLTIGSVQLEVCCDLDASCSKYLDTGSGPGQSLASGDLLVQDISEGYSLEVTAFGTEVGDFTVTVEFDKPVNITGPSGGVCLPGSFVNPGSCPYSPGEF